MAKRGRTTRVFELAKDLGVPSKDIIAKCEAENIPGITNHMSAVSLGLAATIREWFGVGDGGVTTAVQTAAPVDIAAARAKARRAKGKAGKKYGSRDEAPEATETEVMEAELEEVEVKVTAPALAVERPEALERREMAAPAIPPVAEPPVTSRPAEPRREAEQERHIQRPAAAARAEPTPVKKVESIQRAGRGSTSPVMNVPERPQFVRPAGPRLEEPTKTTLAGPKVIRVESPEVVPVPDRRRSRTERPAARSGPSTGRGAGVMMPDQDAAVPGRGGGSGAGGRGGTSRRNKRRSASARPEGGRTGKATSTDQPFNWREQDLLERERRLNRAAGFIRAARRDSQKRSGAGGGHRATTAAETGGRIRIVEPITIKELSSAAGVRVNQIIQKLVKIGKMVMNADAVLDAETATEVMLEHGIELEVVEQKTAKEQIVEQFRERAILDGRSRSPVVAILGHVDHGKTSLLDRIRHTRVAEGEAGGITQATSAFQVPVSVGDEQRMVTFIDTPGHEAFTEMRSRGARVTDIVVLVVAADDGVMPQTVESINHAKAAGVPIVVALNKIDKPEATDGNIQRILGQLAQHQLNPVEWGGQTEVVRTSALKDEGISELLEILDYQAQLLELAADFGGRAEGTVLEAQLEEGRGAVARVLVQEGTLKKGDFIVAGAAYGRVRDIINDRGKRMEEAGPSMPVAISGIDEVPQAGDKFYIVKSLREAENAAHERRAQLRHRQLTTEKVTLDNIFQKLSEQGRKELPLIVKADVHGSLETLQSTLTKIGTEEVHVAIKHAAVGGVNESDVALAEASGAIILGFNVTSSSAARKAAEAKRVDIRFYDVIYDLTDDVKKAAEGLLEPELKLEVLGHAEVRDVFKISKIGMVAGCYVTDGTIERNAQIRVTREGIVVEKDRRLDQLKRFKDDAKEVHAGQECGMRIEGYDDIHAGDVLECYRTLEVRRTL